MTAPCTSCKKPAPRMIFENCPECNRNRNKRHEVKPLRDAGWGFILPSNMALGSWVDPETGREYKTWEALEIQAGRALSEKA
jgi:hypothetical protein